VARTPRPPAIVGAAEYVQRLDDPREALDPVGMMERALRRAADDAGAPGLLAAIDAIYVPRGTWKHGDPGRQLAERVGAGPVTTALGSISGHTVQVLVDRAVRAISEGRHDVVAIVGGESEHSRRRMKRDGHAIPWDEPAPGTPDLLVGSDAIHVLPHEIEVGVFKPTLIFALCDTSLRHARGQTPAAHREHISQLYSRISAVAAENANAWIRRHVSAEEIRTPTPANRFVAYPYTKLMTANIAVDQAAALIVCSEAASRRFGIAADRRVYLRAATEMGHEVSISERELLHHHPGMPIAARRVLERAGVEASDIDHVDLYSCFPFAVQVGAEAVGLDPDRRLSVGGGLTFGGGPFGNYVVQTKARLVQQLRAEPGSIGLVGSVGGSFAKFAYGIYSTDPGVGEPILEDVAPEVAKLPTRPYRADYTGPVRVESYTVDVAREGPTHAIFAGLTEAGERVWARSLDRSLMEALLSDEEACGREGHVHRGRIELG
jgi:acetyl-CoA C-acetyltransferase